MGTSAKNVRVLVDKKDGTTGQINLQEYLHISDMRIKRLELEVASLKSKLEAKAVK